MGKNKTLVDLSGEGNFVVPAGVRRLELYAVKKMMLGSGNSSCMLDADGSAAVWGINANGQLALGDIATVTTPRAFTALGKLKKIAMSANYGSSTMMAFLTEAGFVFTAGVNNSGQLGDGASVTDKSTPVAVIGGHRFIDIDCIPNNVIALKKDGTAWTWGANNNGQLGDNTIVAKSSPVPVVGGHSFISLSPAASTAMLGLKSDGSLWTWGGNLLGTLGDGTTVNKSSPIAIQVGQVFKQTARSLNSCAALRSDGTVWCWGSGSGGQLGNGDVANQSSPVQVLGLTDVIEISGSSSGGYSALKSDGSVWTWGTNSSGDLGDGTIVSKSSPVAVIGGHSFISLGNAKTMYPKAVKADGSVWTWGSGGTYNSGNGVNTNFSSPILAMNGNTFELERTVLLEVIEVEPGQSIPYSQIRLGSHFVPQMILKKFMIGLEV